MGMKGYKNNLFKVLQKTSHTGQKHASEEKRKKRRNRLDAKFAEARAQGIPIGELRRQKWAQCQEILAQHQVRQAEARQKEIASRKSWRGW
jgi:DNA invertase Pin-like site-specific DNA recombinase